MKVLFSFLYLSFVVCSWALHLTAPEWEDFKLKYNKKYSSAAEEHHRKDIFLNNKEKVAAHNVLYDKGVVTFTIGINYFSDKFPEEMAAMRGYRVSRDLRSSADEELSDIDLETGIPDSVDWRKKGAVTPVKNDQDYEESCWAFSATGSLEGQLFLKTKKLVSLSEQNLMDCVHVEHASDGGGDVVTAFNYVKKNGGIDTEASYPFTRKIGKCHYNAKNSGANCTGYKLLPKGNENKLKAALAKFGPISVAIDASSNDIQVYEGGVFYNPNCSTTYLNYAALVVGYGTYTDGIDYWIVKTSWSKNYGDQGYILMSRNKNNNCGIASYASYPTM